MADFHFIRPLWLLAILGLLFTLYLLKKYRVNQSGWQQLLPKHLSKVLIDGTGKSTSTSLFIPFFIGLLAIISLAGPTWKKLPQPVYQLARGSVMVMDMSYSMYSTDISPNRLTRARYKAIDLLNQLNEGEIGLIAYAGDAFTISPLTEDINNIKLLLPSLSPELMPELGSNPLAALTLANSMLTNAGHIEGDIYWFTDGIDYEDVQDITDWSRQHPYRLNIIGIGTLEGAPIKLSNGELMKDNSGAIIIPKLTEKLLNDSATRGNGTYARITHDSDDINALMKQPVSQDDDKKSESNQAGDQWQEFGPYLLLIVLPFVLSYFRRGSLLVLFPCFLFIAPTKNSYADFWTDLWKTKDQQGQIHYKKQEYENAAAQFEDPLWQGSAHYQAGNYEDALASFKQADGIEALYNQGNTLAKLQQLDEAIDAYKQVLSTDPNHEDAKANKALLEKLKEQQDQQQQNQENSDQNNEDQENQDKQKQENQSEQNQQQKGDQEKDQQQQQQKQDQEQQSDQNQQNDEEQQSKSQQEQNDSQEQKEKQEQEAKEAQENDEDSKNNEEQQTQALEVQQAKETEQKHKQLLNKVTDDPYLLLRNKMQLEYQKRRQDRSHVGVKKKW